MIQRIQTLYLLAVAALMGAMHLMPLAGVGAAGSRLELTAYGLVGPGAGSAVVPYLGVLVSLSAVLALAIIFLYKRRQAQIRLCFAGIVLTAGAQVMAVLYVVRFNAAAGQGVTYGVAAVFPLVCAVLTWLAMRGVIRDEATVRSLDRIR